MGILERMRLDNKKAIVTGGSRGLGKYFAVALAEAGADVCIVNTKKESGLKAAEEIAQLGVKAMAVQADISKLDDVNRMVEEVMATFGDIDICVANAGITAHIPALELTLEDWQRVIDVNLTGLFLTCQAVGKVMAKNKKGSIINISSIRSHTASHPQPGCVYPAAKAGVTMLTKSLAKELGPYNVRVNAICPGYFRSDMTAAPHLANNVRIWSEMTALNRMGNPEELQSALIYLASDASGYTTGSEVLVDGGYMTF